MDIKNKIIINFPEHLRTAMGAYYDTISSSEKGVIPEFHKELLPTSPSLTDFAFEDPTIIVALANPDRLEENITGSAVTPSYTVPIRIFGDPGVVKGNNYWEKYIVGGIFGSSSFPGIYSDNIFENLNFNFDSPYTAKEKAEFSFLNTSYGTAPIEISYKYNYYLSRYEAYAAAQNSVKMLPNAYLLAQRQFSNWRDPYTTDEENASSADRLSLDLSAEIKAFLDLEGTTDVKRLFDSIATPYQPPYSLLYEVVDTTAGGTQYIDYTANLRQYFNEDLPNNSISGSTLAQMTKLGNNIIFDNHAMATTFPQVAQQAKKLPFYVDINIPLFRQEDVVMKYGNSRLIRDMLEEPTSIQGFQHGKPNFVSIFMRILKERFADDRSLLAFIPSTDYTTKMKADIETSAIFEDNNRETKALYSLDLCKALIANYNDIKPAFAPGDKNYILINANELTANIVDNLNGSYRYINSQLTLLFLNKILSHMTLPSSLFLQGLPGNINWDFLYRLYEMNSQTNYNEIIAYRIVKIAGPATGDSNTQNIVQNFWLYNYNDENSSIENFNFIDTQVGYNENITYKIFAYVINIGVKYKASDLVLSRVVTKGEDAPEGLVCVEYYEPGTNKIKDPLFEQYGMELTALNNTFGAESNLSTTFAAAPYHADYNLQFEPKISVMEVPLFEKSVSVLDHPAHHLDVTPFQKMDNSQEIGFLLRPESFVPDEMPTPITSDEKTYELIYLESNDMLKNDKTKEKTASPHTFVRIYKMNRRPESIAEFETFIHAEKNLSQKAEGARNPTCLFYDKIKTNHKYYYLFRFFNEHGVMGYLSPVIEAELINDGSYTYSTFNMISEKELEDPVIIDPSLPIKKLINVIPNISQLELDTAGVSFLETAESQIENLKIGNPNLSDTIWGQTFKLRMTSKKTGKKLDINLKFNINDEL